MPNGGRSPPDSRRAAFPDREGAILRADDADAPDTGADGVRPDLPVAVDPILREDRQT